MLRGYFLARDHLYICDKFAHGPTEKDEVYLHGYISKLVRDEIDVTFLETCSQKAGQMLVHTLGFSHPQHLVPACHNLTMHFPVSSACMAIPISTLD